MMSVCPFAAGEGGAARLGGARKEEREEGVSSGKCPLGYDSGSFKLGPFSCIVCRALLFKAARCLPCRHVFCSACIGRFKDCPLCGVDITRLEEDNELQKLVDQFIQGHARLRRYDNNVKEAVLYEDGSLARGSFLLQHAMRAFQAQNLESAKSRLELCVEDTREMLSRKGASSEICSQLGAVLGLLGDCLRSMGDLNGAMDKYAESTEILQRIADRDVEVVHALSVSLNKLGDMKYYADDLQSARALYEQALRVREKAETDLNILSSESMDVVVSMAKIADVERAMGREVEAAGGFAAAMKRLEGLSAANSTTTTTEAVALEGRRVSIMEFLRQEAQNKSKQTSP